MWIADLVNAEDAVGLSWSCNTKRRFVLRRFLWCRLAVVVPCHHVIRQDGNLGGFR
ncbi:MAG: MGMT family protein [Gammaproteobacteria bacterium]